MPYSRFWLLALAIGLNSFLAAQGPASDPKATAILQDSLDALGGNKALGTLSQTVARGTATAILGERTVVSDITIQRQGFLKSRTVARRDGFVQESVRNGRFSWTVTNGEERAFTERNAAQRIDPVDPLTGILRAFATHKPAARYEAEEVLGDRRLHRIALDFPDDDAQRLSRNQPIDRGYELLIDADTLLPAELRIVSDDWDADRPDLWERWIYSDYREAGGALIPFLIEMDHYGNPQLVIQLTDFAASSSGDVFAEPQAAR